MGDNLKDLKDQKEGLEKTEGPGPEMKENRYQTSFLWVISATDLVRAPSKTSSSKLGESKRPALPKDSTVKARGSLMWSLRMQKMSNEQWTS
jgi:hypothetical protein